MKAIMICYHDGHQITEDHWKRDLITKVFTDRNKISEIVEFMENVSSAEIAVIRVDELKE